MLNKNLVGRCGIYCGACTIYRAYQDNGTYREQLANFFACAPEKIRCEGCQALTQACWGNGCKIIKCLNTRGIKYCYECHEYPKCPKFGEIAEWCQKHNEDLATNLSMIKAGKIGEWLEKKDRKWRCPKCGEPVAMSQQNCHWCGAKK